MSPDQVMDFSRISIMLLLKIALPILIVSLVIGLIVSLFQALTQIQEMTLTFVPKLIAIFITLILIMPYIGGQMDAFAQHIFTIISTI